MKKIIALCFFILLIIGKGQSQNPGDLDISFSDDGVAINLTTGYHRVNAIALQADGKIIAAGEGVGDMVLIRYNTDGTLDNSFGSSGVVTLDIAGATDRIDVVKVLPNGRILAGGKNSGIAPQYTLVQFNADGTLDNGFGTGGIAEYSSGAIYDMVVLDNGKILFTGYNSLISSHFSLAKSNADGSLDNSFGTGGVVVTDTDSAEALAYAIAVQSDGKILVGGRKFGATYNQFALNRYNANGTLDNTFGGGDGKTETIIGQPYLAVTFGQAYEPTIFSLLVQPDGKIIAVGQTDVDSTEVFALCRYNVDGSLDNSFGIGGKVTTDIGDGSDIAYEGYLQPDGKILVAGVSTDNFIEQFTVARYNTDGSPDVSFGNNGVVTTIPVGSNEGAFCITMQADNKIVAAGYAEGIAGTGFAVARFYSGLEVGIEENTKKFESIAVYPNPIGDQFSLEYILAKDEKLSITLTDIEGRIITTYFTNASRKAGFHNETFNTPKDLAAGTYLLQIQTSDGGNVGVRVSK